MSLDGSDLAIIIPLWQRTANIQRVLTSMVAVTPKARPVFIVSADDHAVTQFFSLLLRDLTVEYLADGYASDLPRVVCGAFCVVLVDWPGGAPGDYARKINAGYRATDEPFVFTGADDLHFWPGWYDAARAAIDAADPPSYTAVHVGTPGDSTVVDWIKNPQQQIGVVGTNDLCNQRVINGEHSTHSLVARWYADCCAVADQPGAIYHEGYRHEYCDDELVQTAMSRGAYAHASDAIVEHLHPNVGKAEIDDVYLHGRSGSRLSRMLFRRRRRLWAATQPGQARRARR